MPYTNEFVEPEILCTHHHIPVYKTYRNDALDEGARTYWYTLDASHGTDSRCEFDVRELPTWQAPDHPPYVSGELTDEDRAAREAAWARWHADRAEEKAIIAAIQQALDTGDLAPYRCPVPWCDALIPKRNLEADTRCPECHEGICIPWIPTAPDAQHGSYRLTATLECALEAPGESQAADHLAAAIRTGIPDARLLRVDIQHPEGASHP